MRPYIRKALYSTLDIGTGFDRKIFLLNDQNEKISFWNDVPLQTPGMPKNVFNAVIEMPRYTLTKIELARHEPYHPLMHDPQPNKFNPKIMELYTYSQFGCFNYGLFPQTWENVLLPNEKVENLLVSSRILFKDN